MIHQPFQSPDQWQVQKQALVQQHAQVYLHSSLSEKSVKEALLIPAPNLQETIDALLVMNGPQARVAVLPEGPMTVMQVRSVGALREIVHVAIRSDAHAPHGSRIASDLWLHGKGRAMPTIIGVETYDVRFPTSRDLDGSDAMHPYPDYSAAYVCLRTNAVWEGHGLAFTIGRGNEVVVTAIQALAPLVMGVSLEEITDRHGRILAPARERQSTALDWAGEGRHSSGYRGSCQRGVGSVGEVARLSRYGACWPIWRLKKSCAALTSAI